MSNNGHAAVDTAPDRQRIGSLQVKRDVSKVKLEDLRADLREARNKDERLDLQRRIATLERFIPQVEQELREAKGLPRVAPAPRHQVEARPDDNGIDVPFAAAGKPMPPKRGRAGYRHTAFSSQEDVRRVVAAGIAALKEDTALPVRQREAALYILGKMHEHGKNEVGVALRELRDETGMPVSSAQRAVDALHLDGQWVKKTATPRMNQNLAWQRRGKKYGHSPTFFRLSRGVEALAARLMAGL